MTHTLLSVFIYISNELFLVRMSEYMIRRDYTISKHSFL